MAFVHYLSRDPRPGHRGESLRTRRVADAWTQIRRFLAECTDDPAPRTVELRVDTAVDGIDDATTLTAEVASVFGSGTEWRSSSGDEHAYEWSVDAVRLTDVVAICAQHEARPRIHVNAAVRRHRSAATPQVTATIAYDIAMRCGVVDTHAYQSGWGQSQLRAYLGLNEIWLALHLPFSTLGPELEQAVAAIESALGHVLSRDRLRIHR